MAINFDKAFGIHQHTIGVRSERAEVLASNIANGNTPNYKAKDHDFKTALANAQQGLSYSLNRTHNKHFKVDIAPQTSLKFRVPNQPDTGDGNTVDVQTERNMYLQNALEYQASIRFMDGKVKGLLKAISGQ